MVVVPFAPVTKKKREPAPDDVWKLVDLDPIFLEQPKPLGADVVAEATTLSKPR